MKLSEVVDRKVKIENILRRSFDLNRFTINDDLTVDVDGDVLFSRKSQTQLPINFRTVTGCFSILDCKKLTTLKGCPQHVGSIFEVRNAQNLRSLEHGPQTVGESYIVFNSSIKSLEHCPTDIPERFIIEYCYFITSLKGCPEKIGERFSISNCQYLKSLDYLPKEILGKVYLFNCDKVFNLLRIFKIKGVKSIRFHKNPIEDIINKYLPSRDIIGCQDELIEAGFEEYARTK
jgi:hypothetical protein